MSRYYSYLNSTIGILKEYNGEIPFATFLKKFFAANKKYGSKDRKHIAGLCYCYFRTGKAFSDLSIEEKIIAGLFLCSGEHNEMLAFLKPAWNEQVSLSSKEKIKIVDNKASIQQIFPWTDECSDGMTAEKFNLSFLIQPDLFLRIRPGYEKQVIDKLKKADIAFQSISDNSLSFPNTTKIDGVLSIDKEVVIQDLSSQKVQDFFPPNNGTIKTVWDCCAASGGKSILAIDTLGKIELTVSDLRENILFNLKKRFFNAGVKNYKSFIVDLSKSANEINSGPFDLIIADVPCSGSGTWSRTPEQLFYFEKEKIDEYSKLQKSILANVTSQLKPGGYLFYITCSVFNKENEDGVSFLLENNDLKLLKKDLIKGYENKADTMFAALLQKSL